MVKRIIKSDDIAGYTPFSLAILYGWIAFAVVGIASFIVKTLGGPSMTLGFELAFLEAITNVFIAFGAGFMIVSSRVDELGLAWKLDNIGIRLSLGGWIGYTIGILKADWMVIGGVSICLLFIAAIITRWVSTYTYEKFIRMRVSKLWNHG